MKFKKYIHLPFLLLLMAMYSTVILKEHLTIGSLFASFHFIPIYLFVYGFKASISRDMLLFELSHFIKLDKYLLHKAIEKSKEILVDVSVLIFGAIIIVWINGGTIKLSHILLYFIALNLFTLLYSMMMLWSKLALHSSIPVALVIFALSTQGWLVFDTSVYLNPFVSLYNVFAVIVEGPGPMPVPYNLTAIIGYFVSLFVMFILFVLIINLKKRWNNL